MARNLFVRADDLPPLHTPWSTLTAREAAKNVLRTAFREDIDVSEVPEGVLEDPDDPIARALVVVLHRNEVVRAQLRRAVDTGDVEVLKKIVADLVVGSP